MADDDAADDDVYDLAVNRAAPQRPTHAGEDGPVRPAVAGPGATPGRPGRTLGYARPGTVNSRTIETRPTTAARGEAADPLLSRRERRRRLTAPAWLCGLGAVAFVGIALLITDGDLRRAAAFVGVSLAWDVLVVFLGLLVGSRFVDLEADSTGTLTLQISAVVLADAAVFWPIMWLDNGMFCGALFAFVASWLVYCFLLGYFFELEINEVVVLAVVVHVVRLCGNLVYWQAFGTFGYFP